MMDSHYTINQPTIRAKRTFDVSFSLIGLLLTLPLFPLIALAIKLNSKGPIFYRQLTTGATLATKDDTRVTLVGRFLRKTRLDELPQFINVLKGDMSLVGPRPERPTFYNKLEHEIPYFSERTYGVLPGITGLAQVNQGYDTCIDDVRSKVGFDHSYALSLRSISSWLRTDLSILLMTIKVMLFARGQ